MSEELRRRLLVKEAQCEGLGEKLEAAEAQVASLKAALKFATIWIPRGIPFRDEVKRLLEEK